MAWNEKLLKMSNKKVKLDELAQKDWRSRSSSGVKKMQAEYMQIRKRLGYVD